MMSTGDLRYVGIDAEFAGVLAGRLRDLGGSLETYCNLDALIDRLNEPASFSIGTEDRNATADFGKRFSPVLLDIDGLASFPGTLLAFRSWDGGVPLIVVGTAPTLLQFSLSRLHGAEGCHSKQPRSIDGLLGSIEGAHRKLQRWQHTLEVAACTK